MGVSVLLFNLFLLKSIRILCVKGNLCEVSRPLIIIRQSLVIDEGGIYRVFELRKKNVINKRFNNARRANAHVLSHVDN